jgi:hypothetical protein
MLIPGLAADRIKLTDCRLSRTVPEFSVQPKRTMTARTAGVRNCRRLFDDQDASYHVGHRLRKQVRDRSLDCRPGDAAEQHKRH